MQVDLIMRRNYNELFSPLLVNFILRYFMQNNKFFIFPDLFVVQYYFIFLHSQV